MQVLFFKQGLGNGSHTGAIFGDGANSGTKNLYYLEGCCGEDYQNNWSSYVTEITAKEMLKSDFVGTLNNGESAWIQDTEVYNSGYPVLNGIDYTVFASYCSVHPLDLYCTVVVLDAITFQPIDMVQVIDNESNTMIDYTGANGIVLLSGSALKLLSDTSLLFSKDGYQPFSCYYSDLETDTLTYQSINHIYMTPNNENAGNSKEQFFIGEHVYFIENGYDNIAPCGFYNAAWKGEDGAHLWTYYLWEGIGDVLELCTLKVDDLMISVDFYDIFMSDLILELTENELNDRLLTKSYNTYEKVYKNVTDNIVTEFIKYCESDDKDKTYEEIWGDASLLGEKLNKLLKGEP